MHEATPQIQVVYHFEQRRPQLLRCRARSEQAAHRQVHHLAPIGRDQRVGRLLHPVVEKCVSLRCFDPDRRTSADRRRGLDDQAFGDGRLQVFGSPRRRLLDDNRERLAVEPIPDARGQRQRILRIRR